ncbi:AsmA-like C-terminal domain-containing protein [Devosia sp. SL43]|uniref:AsmA-like C-terminal domain-containing protein n=1 Tax=Devosia sp. SL43 TaxID=2806348 RepID=UPI001F3178A8|nr:AsmA-like C-terminal domain-containing protein [Devosia sp. SL43]UJW86274.1 AsmA-like C-terminal domain-containing protein [Devosia sp. SL43]
MRRAAKLAVWVFGVPAVLSLLLYIVLLITPVRLPFGAEAAQAVARAALPPTSRLQLGQMALALENGVWPVIQFSPVVLTDGKTGARVAMDALEVGFSPARALFGQPGATVTIVRPHIQIVQDLFGPRVTSFELVEDPAGGPPTVRVQEGEDAFPTIDIGSEGIDLGDMPEPIAMRSDNDWLIYNLEASEQGIADIVEQAAQGRFSRLRIRDGTIDMNDSVYGLFRRFERIDLEIGPTPDRRATNGTFSATLGGRTMTGSLSRTVDDAGNSRLEADVTNIDFAAFLPFIDDATSVAAMRGAGALSIDVNFSPAGGKLIDGRFKVDLTGLDLRVADAYFPIASSIMDIVWDPANGQFVLEDAALQIGQSSARISGIFAMGLDPVYGPTIGISLKAQDVVLHPNDMAAPEQPFETMEFSGWSAPLYGALGIDRFIARKGDSRVETTGRVDMLRAGLGIDMTVAGNGVTADDLKRLWPYIMGGESRDWFVANVTEGTVARSRMAFKFPVGSMALDGESKPIPDGAMQIDMVGVGVAIKPTAEMAPIAVEGETRLQVNDSDVTISATGGTLSTAAGDITVSNPALIMDNSTPGDSIAEISGDITGSIPALLAITKDLQPDALASADLPIDIGALTGVIDLGLVATIHLADEASGKPMDLDYVLNGTVADFASSVPIQGRTINDGQLMFSASQDSYQLGGTAALDGMEAEVNISGTPTTDPTFRLSSTIDVADLAKMGFDASDFLSGTVRFVAQPMPDGSLQMAVDLKDAALDIKDIGISKPAGNSGTVSATIRQDGELTELTDIDLSFGTVRALGGIEYHATNGLVSAEFSQFGLSEGDSAQLRLAPIDGGYSVDITGQQLDLKPMLRQFFSLGDGAGGVQSTQFTQTIALKAKLNRALGYYATTAFNLDLDLLLRGSTMRRANLTAQFSDGNGLSVTTNPAPNGRTLSVAFNDAGTILRLLGVYSQLAGGSGNLVLTTDSTQDVEAGQLVMRGFSIVDEANVAQVLGNHSDSRSAIAQQNRLDFDVAQVDFLRRSDRVEVTNAMLTGDTVGGTMRGYIYTGQKQYDLTGTYVPLFGLNSAFQKIPLLGPLLGGRDGEGLVGVTFAVQGPLDNPQFRINPLSMLVPGAFRELFEFRAKEQPAPAQ